MGAPKNPCTSLVKYDPRQFQWLRAQSVLVKGHHFRREADWLCACGLRRPRGVLAGDLPPCTVLLD